MFGQETPVSDSLPVRFEIRHRDDLWEVLCDGRLRGGYVSQSGAQAAVDSAMLDLVNGGGRAELVATSGDEGQ